MCRVAWVSESPRKALGRSWRGHAAATRAGRLFWAVVQGRRNGAGETAGLTVVLAFLLACLAAPAGWAATGGLDPSFGPRGYVKAPFTGEQDAPRDLIVDSQSRPILFSTESKLLSVDAAGTPYFDYRGEIARWSSGGVLDDGFAGDGVRELGPYQYEGPGAGPGAVLPSDDLLTTDHKDVIALDAGGQVIWRKPLYSGPDRRNIDVREIFVEPSGAFVVAGTEQSYQGTNTDVGWLSYRHPDGSPDLSYGPDGIKTFPLPDSSFFRTRAVLRRPSGEIVVVGFASLSEPGLSVQITQVGPDGTPDPGFGRGGSLVYRLPRGAYNVSASTLTADGALLVAVSADRKDRPWRAYISRLLPDGSFDATFGKGGHLTVRREVEDLVPLPDGRVFDIGFAGDTGTEVRRLEQNGTLDRTWGGGDGVASTPALRPLGGVLDGGRLLVVGTRYFRDPGSPHTSRQGAQLVAFSIEDPGDDADLDGISDESDLCPESPSRRPEGCPLAHRPFDFYISRGEYSFDLRGYPYPRIFYACRKLNRIRVVRLTPDGPKTVYRATAGATAYYYPQANPPRSGRYRAILPGFIDDQKARCATQRSRVIRVHSATQASPPG